MKIERVFPKPPPEFSLTFSKEEGWSIVMALKDAYDRYEEASERDQWLRWAGELDAKLRQA